MRSTTRSCTTARPSSRLRRWPAIIPCLTFSGLSKVHRACGWRVGWAMLSGAAAQLGEFRAAMDLLSALRLCANVPGQYAIEAAVNGPDTISALCAPGGRLYETRRAVIDACNASEHLDLVAPAGALYAFPAVVGPAAKGFDDHDFALELMNEEGVLVVPGSSFNVPYRHHFRVTLLPEAEVMREVFATHRPRPVAPRRSGEQGGSHQIPQRGCLSHDGTDRPRVPDSRPVALSGAGRLLHHRRRRRRGRPLAARSWRPRCAPTASRWPTRRSSPPLAGPLTS